MYVYMYICMYVYVCNVCIAECFSVRKVTSSRLIMVAMLTRLSSVHEAYSLHLKASEVPLEERKFTLVK